NALQLAQMIYEEEEKFSSRQRPSSRQIQQLENSIEKTRMLLTRIREYCDFRNIGFVSQQVGGDVVAPAAQGLPRNPTISDQELDFPHFHGNGKVVGINIEPLLRATLLHARRRRRGPGGPKKSGKEAIVRCAKSYFVRYSPKEPSTDCKHPFQEFAERFYEVVAKTEPG